MRQFGAWTADVYLDDVAVGPGAIVGGESGRGYVTAMRCLAHGRVHIAALSVGMADRLVDESVSYATQRTQGGRPISSYQLVQGMLADRAVQIHGGSGYMRTTAGERFYRDARLFRIYEGTSQIQQLIIARQVLGDSAGP